MVARRRPDPVCQLCGTPKPDGGLCPSCIRYLEVRETFLELTSAGAYEHGNLAVPESTPRTWRDWGRTHADLDARPFWRCTVAQERAVVDQLSDMLRSTHGGSTRPRRPMAGTSEAARLLAWVSIHSADVPAAELVACEDVYRCRVSIHESARRRGWARQTVQVLLKRLTRRAKV